MTARQHRRPGTIPRTLVPPDRSTVSMRLPGFGTPAGLQRDGRVVSRGRVWDAEREGLPPGTDTELLAEAGGLLQGRFLLTPGTGTPLTLEQRLVAVAFADPVGAALSGGRLAGRRR